MRSADEILQDQLRIINSLDVQPTNFDPKKEIQFRTLFLEAFLSSTGRKGFVLGISGGQDSALAGKLCQMAVNNINRRIGVNTLKFIALRLPYGEQADESEAWKVLEWIEPTQIISVNIKDPVDASERNLLSAVPTLWDHDSSKLNFLAGNIKARERMKVHYDIAGALDLIVIGTDHAAEALTGFFTKYGDGGTDAVPLAGLTKRQGKAMLKELNAPDFLQTKVPTADLRNDIPQQPDEIELGLTYDQIDDFLEGKDLNSEVCELIIQQFKTTEHKRNLPVTPFDTWWLQE